ncbi:ATP-binding cassette domain-containing protein [Pseudohoeflea sp. DP4N28-3]|uniref:ATP-binding cassette domain-containing protein n=2 Tax=Pseudohoeflea coraliihabitans TaxID=2860393 RepID=A0ABS6WMX8_9HYPH|nr:ATP-binding cassette domain-containing protein [Pseudohoeflea sp. DP4N28-3]MBW3097303.1 ATP-binding cassette domain-containing protein [Pseudohoeflea sp. DP4N28-3]
MPAQGGTLSSWDDDPVLTVEHLTMRFGGLVAVNDLSFNVGRGDITALIGPNGAGKTTVFNCVTGFYKPTEGRIVMRHGRNVPESLIASVTNSGEQHHHEDGSGVFLLERMPDFMISRRAKVARTFQNIRLFAGMTVLENLLVAQHNPLMVASNFTIGGLIGLPGYKKSRAESIDKAVYWMEQVRLIDRADDPAGDLPYGAQRRLEIARAMCTDPHLLCLDEPAAGLNPRESAELNELLQFIRQKHGTSILLIEHDMGVVMQISDHIVVLDYGEKISDGDAEFVRNDPKVIAAYLGVEDEEEVEEVLEEDAALAAGKSVGEAPGEDSPERPLGTTQTDVTGDESGPVPKSAELDPIPPAAAASAAALGEPADGPAADAAQTPMAGALSTARDGRPDKLTRISGIGPVNEHKLNAHGIFHFDQIAAWTAEDVKQAESYLAFDGRIAREDWVGQARQLAAGEDTEFSRREDRKTSPRDPNGKGGAK